MKNRFELIIFDWDGTLVDSVDWIVQCIQAASSAQGYEPPASTAIKDIIGLSIDNALLRLFPHLTDHERQSIALDYGQAFFSRQTGPEDLFPGVEAMLRHLRQRGYRLAVATGKKSMGLERAIAGTGISELFCATRCSDQTASKPDPLMIDEIVAELGVCKSRTLMVGDSAHDMQMALNANVAAVGVTCGAHSETVLQQFGPLRCLSFPTELTDLI